MAATCTFFTNRSPKLDIATGSPLTSRIIKTYTRPSVVNYALTPCAIRSTCSPIVIPRTLFNGLATQNKVVSSRLLCSSDPAGFTSPLEGYKQFYAKLRQWCDKQSLPVGGAVYIIFHAFDDGLFGLVWRFLGGLLLDLELKPPHLEVLKTYTGSYYPLVLVLNGKSFCWARVFAILSASYYGIPYVLKRLRGGEEDVLSSIARNFITTVLLLVVFGMRSPKIIIIGGVISALLAGLKFKLRVRGSELPQAEDDKKS